MRSTASTPVAAITPIATATLTTPIPLRAPTSTRARTTWTDGRTGAATLRTETAFASGRAIAEISAAPPLAALAPFTAGVLLVLIYTRGFLRPGWKEMQIQIQTHFGLGLSRLFFCTHSLLLNSLDQ
jgi:hypothetical protein